MNQLKLNFSLTFISYWLFYVDYKVEAFGGDYISSWNSKDSAYRQPTLYFPFTMFKIDTNENENTIHILRTMENKHRTNSHYDYNHNHHQKEKNNKNIENIFISLTTTRTPIPISNAFTINSSNITTKKNTNIMSLVPSISTKTLFSSSSSTSSSSFISPQSNNLQQLPSNSVEIPSKSVDFIEPEFTSISTIITTTTVEDDDKQRKNHDILLKNLENKSKNVRYRRNTTTTTISKETINDWNNKTTIPSLFSSFSNTNSKHHENYGIPTVNDSNVIISSRRDIRDVSNFEEDEIGWTNINEEVDMTIPLVLSHFQELSMTHFTLPDVTESISVSPLFITYSAELTLFNGAAYNIEGIYRNGDAMMTYRDKAFQFRLNLIIKKLQFEYDFIAKAMIVSIAGGVVGTLENISVAADFSIDARDPVLRLNDFKIEKFGNIIVQLNHNRIVQELSTFVLTPITNLFRDRITTTISVDIKDTISEMLIDFSNKDQLGIKKFTKQVLAGLIKGSSDSSEKSSN